MKPANPWRIVDRVIDESDILLEVIDARMPNLTRNRKVEGKIRRKRKFLILVMNKSDLITWRMRTAILQEYGTKEAILISCKDRRGIVLLRKLISDMARRVRHKGYIGVGVIGYPNTGKSSVINVLVGFKTVAKTSPIAGFTKNIQWVKGRSNIMFLDTPGVIPFGESDEAEQALISAKDPNKLENPDFAAMRIIKLFLDNDKTILEKFYDFKVESNDSNQILLQIGKRRNLLRKGGGVDETRTAMMVIRDWQNGRLLLNR
jgi:ribosome biogenesis GTPase A